MYEKINKSYAILLLSNMMIPWYLNNDNNSYLFEEKIAQQSKMKHEKW